MRLSLEWLSDHVDLAGLEPAEVGELYTLHVAECSVEVPGGGWPGVQVGLVTGVRPHPNADKLRLVAVEAGDGAHEVVCGAPNVAEGQKICFAPEGTTLPDGLVLKRRKIRGVESAGMVLSERELGLSDEHEGILVLDDSCAVGTPARDVLPGGAALEVDNTAITTRPDLWGHYGAARELAAVLRRELWPLELGAPLPDGDSAVAVDVETPDLCPRYLGWVIAGVQVGPSPEWLRRRLEAAGQRTINNVVDLTNYILLECGQPLHAFDRRQIAQGRIVVRAAAKDEPVTTLDGIARTLPEGACVIADPERAVAIAGVMGLQNSEVGDDTTEIVLEVANFDPVSIRRTAMALGLRTESAVRFEKGLDPEGVPTAARRFLELLQRVCPTAKAVGGPCDVRTPPERPRRIEMADDFVGRRLGIPLEPETVADLLGRIGFEVARGKGRMRVTVPTWRAGRDVAIAEDLVEEVGRIHGYDQIPPLPVAAALEPVPEEPERAARRRARRALTDRAGLCEVHLYPFVTAAECERLGIEPGGLRLANAEQPGLDLMTPSLLPGLLKAAAENLKYRDEAGLYAIQPVFEAVDGALPRQDERIAVAFGRRGATSPVLAVKGAVEACLEAFAAANVRIDQTEDAPAWLHPGRAARVGRGRQLFGWMGELHPRVARAYDFDGRVALADLDLVALRAAQGKPKTMEPISRYPTVPFDIAVVVDRRTPARDVAAALRKVDPKLVRAVELFDVYEGKNLPADKRSLAFSVVFGAQDRTLDTADVERLRAGATKALEKRGWTVRG